MSIQVTSSEGEKLTHENQCLAVVVVAVVARFYVFLTIRYSFKVESI